MSTNDDPTYVRLATRLQEGIVADVLGTGWSIAGLDVRKFPSSKNRQAQRFVRLCLNQGKLEPASKAEWDEAHDNPAGDEYAAQQKSRPDIRKDVPPIQESKLQKVAAEAAEELRSKRGVDAEAEFQEDLEADRQDRLERLREAEEAGMNTDDPEEQKAISAGQKKGGKKGKKKSSDDDSAPS
jgi:hypothetical protein